MVPTHRGQALVNSVKSAGAGVPVNDDLQPLTDVCRVCGNPGPFTRYQLREMLFGTRETFEYLRCPTCGVMQIAKLPADLGKYYPNDYFGTSAAASSTPSIARLKSFARRARGRVALFGWVPLARLVAACFGGPRQDDEWVTLVRRARTRSYDAPILDVGCGRTPSNLASLQAAGFRNLRGIDPFLEHNEVWQGIPLERSSIHDCEGQYQLVMMHHSFEHMPDPADVMVSARRLLTSSGVVVIRTPVMGTWFWDHYRTSWWELDPPRHLFIHTTESLKRSAAMAGLELYDIVWDSSFVEMIASEQITRDVAWREPESWATNAQVGFSDALVDSYRDWVAKLNTTGNAGRAGFYFRIATHGHSLKSGADG